MRAGYLDSMQAGGVDVEFTDLHREALTRVVEAARLDELCHRMRTLVAKAGVEETVSDQVLAAYRRLGAQPRVAVRSSATGEDGRDACRAPGSVEHHFGVGEPGRRDGGTPHGSRCRVAPAAGVGTGTQRKSLVGTIAREEQLCYTLTPNRQSLNWTR